MENRMNNIEKKIVEKKKTWGRQCASALMDTMTASRPELFISAPAVHFSAVLLRSRKLSLLLSTIQIDVIVIYLMRLIFRNAALLFFCRRLLGRSSIKHNQAWHNQVYFFRRPFHSVYSQSTTNTSTSFIVFPLLVLNWTWSRKSDCRCRISAQRPERNEPLYWPLTFKISPLTYISRHRKNTEKVDTKIMQQTYSVLKV